MSRPGVQVHPTALVESDAIGSGTSIWAFCHVMSGAVIGRDCNIGDGCYIESGARIGDRVTIKNGCALWEGVTVEDGAFIGPGAVFTNDTRPRSPRAAHGRARYADAGWLERTTVREGATIGAAAVILPGLVIGAYAMVAAGAVVTHDVPEHGLAVGSPARRMGWVCVCGRPLALGDASARCDGCGATFAIADGGPRVADHPDDG